MDARAATHRRDVAAATRTIRRKLSATVVVLLSALVVWELPTPALHRRSVELRHLQSQQEGTP